MKFVVTIDDSEIESYRDFFNRHFSCNLTSAEIIKERLGKHFPPNKLQVAQMESGFHLEYND